MNNELKYWFETLENSTEENFIESFYFFCQEQSPIEIKKCFLKQNIASKISAEVISFGLMGTARSNKLNNAITLLDYSDKNNRIEKNDICFASSINLAIKKENFQFAQHLIQYSHCLEENTYSLMNEKEDKVNIPFYEELQPIGRTIRKKYNKFDKPSLEIFSTDKEKLDFLLKYKIHSNAIKNLIAQSIKTSNMMALICIVKSQYLESLKDDEDIKVFTNGDSDKDMKEKFQHLIENALLEKNLNQSLPVKNNKINSIKI